MLQPPKLPSPNKINAIDSKDKTKTKNKKNKITKGDISNPLNFEHLGHSDSYDDYLRGIGISDQHLNNTKTRELLYGIIEDHHKNQSIHDVNILFIVFLHGENNIDFACTLSFEKGSRHSTKIP